jgi:hypothetical protein
MRRKNTTKTTKPRKQRSKDRCFSDTEDVTNDTDIHNKLTKCSSAINISKKHTVSWTEKQAQQRMKKLFERLLGQEKML